MKEKKYEKPKMAELEMVSKEDILVLSGEQTGKDDNTVSVWHFDII